MKKFIIIIMCIMPILAHSQAPIMLRKQASHKRINLRITHTIGKRLDMVGNALVAGAFASVIYTSYKASTGKPVRHTITIPLCLGVGALTLKSIGEDMMQK